MLLHCLLLYHIFSACCCWCCHYLLVQICQWICFFVSYHLGQFLFHSEIVGRAWNIFSKPLAIYHLSLYSVITFFVCSRWILTLFSFLPSGSVSILLSSVWDHLGLLLTLFLTSNHWLNRCILYLYSITNIPKLVLTPMRFFCWSFSISLYQTFQNFGKATLTMKWRKCYLPQNLLTLITLPLCFYP